MRLHDWEPGPGGAPHVRVLPHLLCGAQPLVPPLHRAQSSQVSQLWHGSPLEEADLALGCATDWLDASFGRRLHSTQRSSPPLAEPFQVLPKCYRHPN